MSVKGGAHLEWLGVGEALDSSIHVAGVAKVRETAEARSGGVANTGRPLLHLPDARPDS